MRTLIVFIAFLAVCTGHIGGRTNNTIWNALQLKWMPVKTDGFFNMPKTVQEALDNGFIKISDCDLTSPWRGARYAIDNTRAIILLFDVKGNIAGIQNSVPTDPSNGYPTAALQPPFIKDGDMWVVTVYFQDPAKICTTGRKNRYVIRKGLGSNLYFQNSTSPEDSMLIPRYQTDIVGTKWTEGLCFETMGKHYWYNFVDDLNCDAIFPLFLLYNGGQLNGLGLIYTTHLTHSIFEHPTVPVLPKTIQPVPTCMNSVAAYSSLHMFLTDKVELNLC